MGRTLKVVFQTKSAQISILNTKVFRSKINILHDSIYMSIRNGAYKAGFSSDQVIYEQAFKAYFDTFAELDGLLADGRFFLLVKTSLKRTCGYFQRYTVMPLYIIYA